MTHDNGIHTDAEMDACLQHDLQVLEDAYHDAIRTMIPDVRSGEITIDQAVAIAQPQFDEWFDLRIS